jgi:hypothetical protein
MNKPTFKCVGIWKPELESGLDYSNAINQIIEEQASEGYQYHETVHIDNHVLIYFKFVLYKM